MKQLMLVVGPDAVAARLGDVERRADLAGTLQSVWQSAVDATAAVVHAVGAPSSCTVVDATDDVAVWDAETLGAARAPLRGPDPFADRVRALRTSEPHLWALVDAGRYAIGSLGGYLLARLTRGVWHVISASAAERLGIATLTDVPALALPEVRPPGTSLGSTDRSFAGLEVSLVL